MPTCKKGGLPAWLIGDYVRWMTKDDGPEFTHEQGLAVAGTALLVGIGLLYFSGDRWVELGTIAFGAIAATVFVQRHLLRRVWFLTFLAVMVVAHLGAVLAFPLTDLDRSSFKLVALADVLGVLGLAFGLEKLASLRE